MKKATFSGALVLPVLAFFSSACGGGGASPSYAAGKSREDIALHTAARDLNCPINELKIVAQANRRYINESSFRRTRGLLRNVHLHHDRPTPIRLVTNNR